MSTADPLIGRTLAGRFRITAPLGEGGMATVYRGEQDEEPRAIAIKIMNADLARDAKFVKRFRREAKSAALLQHPSTVKIIDYGVEDDLPYIVMELLVGAELLAILHHEKRLSEARAARIMAEVLSALSFAHEQGIVHRDLKPENIMVVRNPADPSVERVKVLDFGIAKILEPDVRTKSLSPDAPPPSSLGRTALTMMGTIVGTPEYMSPEQSRGGTIDARSDVYACGVLLYHLVTGQVPFRAELPFETAMLHITATPEKPSKHTPAIHPGLEALILKAMAKAPADRPESARAMQEVLIDLLPDLSPEQLSPAAAMPVPAAPLVHQGPTQPSMEVPVAAIPEPEPEPGEGEKPAEAEAAAGDPGVAGAPGEGPTPPSVPDPLAKTIAMEGASPIVLPDPPKPVAPAKPLAVLPRPRASALSPAAALLIGAGLGALVLAILALLLLRR
jgi:eukaryotic-like serine/threonine-protein kinase